MFGKRLKDKDYLNTENPQITFGVEPRKGKAKIRNPVNPLRHLI